MIVMMANVDVTIFRFLRKEQSGEPKKENETCLSTFFNNNNNNSNPYKGPDKIIEVNENE